MTTTELTILSALPGPGGTAPETVKADDIDVHGGVTFNKAKMVDGEQSRVIGFDTMHTDSDRAIWDDLKNVKAEVESMARQAWGMQ